ncbi:hypothetical protein [uncultured Tateyamaria sp.]|uniref:hypothetical protein n=1 Tax=Tateyamaria sp. 1078 TaxID=3417464 RepID=UPI002630FA4D|nr:hypothetical protein [uncultured Tateyamaria sp.]
MSFLPYAPQRSTTWAASIGGSTAIHGAVVFGLLTSSVALLPEPSSPAVREPEYEITLEIIDADIIDLDDAPDIPEDAVAIEPEDATADVLEEADDALALEEDAALLEPEDAETLQPDAEDDTLAPVEEVAEPEPEPLQEEELALLEPEVLEPEPELVAPEPEVIAPEPDVLAEPEAPIVPEPQVDPDDLAIDDLSLVGDDVFNPLAEAVAPAADTPLAPDVVVPDVVEPEAIIEEDIAAVVLPEPDVIAPEPEIIQPEPEVEPETPAALPEVIEEDPEPEIVEDPEPAEVTEPADITEDPAVADPAEEDTGTATAGAIPNPSPAALQIGALLQRIRETPAPQCTLVLPRRAGDDGVGLSFIGAEPDTLETLAARIVDGLDTVPAQTREILDPRQCAALDAIRQSAAYPASRIGLALDDTTLNSGEALRARVLGAGGLFLTLILVDDNGVIQDLARFTTLDGNDPVIEAPVARTGPARDTRQMLIVLGSTDAPIDLSGGIGQLAQDAFAALPREVLETSLFGLATFDVR